MRGRSVYFLLTKYCFVHSLDKTTNWVHGSIFILMFAIKPHYTGHHHNQERNAAYRRNKMWVHPRVEDPIKMFRNHPIYLLKNISAVTENRYLLCLPQSSSALAILNRPPAGKIEPLLENLQGLWRGVIILPGEILVHMWKKV